MFNYYQQLSFFRKVFIINTLIFILFYFTFLVFPNLDIYISEIFFKDSQFLSETSIWIKDFRILLKNVMVAIPICAILYLVVIFKRKKYFKYSLKKKKIVFSVLGLILGPIIGCGLVANLYFKDTWGRARPVNIEHFNGEKKYTPPFIKSDQCEKNCSWIGGETSAAFSFLFAVFILNKPIFLFNINLIFGTLVTFGRMAMGGHFFSDNLFAAIFMIYLALMYRKIVFHFLRK